MPDTLIHTSRVSLEEGSFVCLTVDDPERQYGDLGYPIHLIGTFVKYGVMEDPGVHGGKTDSVVIHLVDDGGVVEFPFEDLIEACYAPLGYRELDGAPVQGRS